MEVEYHFYQYCPAILVIFESYLSVPKISKDIKCFKENIFLYSTAGVMWSYA